MTPSYTQKSIEAITAVLAKHRNSGVEVIAREIQAAFPFNKGNIDAWKEYKKQIKLIWGR